MWKFDKSSDSGSAEGEQREYREVSPGRHNARFVAVMKQASKGGFDQYVFKLIVSAGADKGLSVIYRITLSEKAEVFAKRAWMAANHDHPIDFFSLDSVKECFLGRNVEIDVSHREWGGKTRAQVERIYRGLPEIEHQSADEFWNNPVFGKIQGSSDGGGKSWNDSNDDIPF